MTSDQPLHLNDFPAAGDAAWRKLVDKVLAGADFDKKLVARTYDGLTLKPLYTRADWPSEGDPSGLPGAAPFTRGATPTGNAPGWDIRQLHGGRDAGAVNAAILEDLERGVTSIVLAADAAADLEQQLAGVMLDLAPVALDGGDAQSLMRLVSARGAAATFAGNFGIEDVNAVALVKEIAAKFPKARAITVRGNLFQDAGAADAQELGAAIAKGLAHLRALTADGLTIDAACGQIAFTLAADADFFLTIAKFRAFRRLWARVTEVCGAGVRTAPVTARTALRMMSQRDPWVNVLRTTVACFGAGVGGADAITVLPLDAAIGPPSALARRVARNIHFVLQEEASLAKVIDPAGGAWMFERLTDELAAKAWTFFQEIEAKGGFTAAEPWVAEQIAVVQAERAKNIARRKDALTGVSEFPNIAEPDPQAATGGPNRLASGFERLRDKSDAFKRLVGERPRVFLANLGAIADFTARATFAKNFFEAGGIEAVMGSGGNDAAGLARDFARSGAVFACICGTDALYAAHAADTAKALVNVGAFVYLAGRPGEAEGPLKAAGVSAFIYMGADVLGILERAYARLEAA